MLISPMKKVNMAFIVVGIILFIMVGYFLRGYVDQQRTDCNSLAVDYLEYTKRKYQSDQDDTVWKNAVEMETIIHNICSRSPSDRAGLIRYIKSIQE